MILIYGGYYQGKKEFAKRKYNLREEECFNIKASIEDFNIEKVIKEIEEKRCIYGFENLIRNLVDKDIDVNIDEVIDSINLEGKIIIVNDVTQGVVPISRKDRKFREFSGKATSLIADKAYEVIRIFAGLEMKLK